MSGQSKRISANYSDNARIARYFAAGNSLRSATPNREYIRVRMKSQGKKLCGSSRKAQQGKITDVVFFAINESVS
jgi:hypothetical protein